MCSLEVYGLRLEGRGQQHEGRVAIRIGGQWGTFCTTQVDSKALIRTGDVICRELGIGLALHVYGMQLWLMF